MHPAEHIVYILDKIYKAGLTTTSGGNISIKDAEGHIWISPAALDKGNLKAKDIMCVKKDGTVEGIHTASSEYPFHKAVYEKRPDIKALIHAHSPALLAFSLVHKIPNTELTPAISQICGKVGYAGYALPGSKELGKKIAEEFKPNIAAVIMENHGVIVAGTDLQDAYKRFETLEFAAKTLIAAETLGEAHYLSAKQIKLVEQNTQNNLENFVHKISDKEEKEKRKEIIHIINRAYKQGITPAFYTAVSIRLQENNFLITPDNIPPDNLDIKDLVLIKNKHKEKGKQPDRSVQMHQAIYNANPDINSIIITQTSNITAFGIAAEKINVRTIPESWILLQDVLDKNFEAQFKADFAENFTKKTPALIIRNDSIILTGNTLLQTFDRLEVAEMSAKSLLMSNPLGKLVPINDKEVEELSRISRLLQK